MLKEIVRDKKFSEVFYDILDTLKVSWLDGYIKQDGKVIIQGYDRNDEALLLFEVDEGDIDKMPRIPELKELGSNVYSSKYDNIHFFNMFSTDNIYDAMNTEPDIKFSISEIDEKVLKKVVPHDYDISITMNSYSIINGRQQILMDGSISNFIQFGHAMMNRNIASLELEGYETFCYQNKVSDGYIYSKILINLYDWKMLITIINRAKTIFSYNMLLDITQSSEPLITIEDKEIKKFTDKVSSKYKSNTMVKTYELLRNFSPNTFYSLIEHVKHDCEVKIDKEYINMFKLFLSGKADKYTTIFGTSVRNVLFFINGHKIFSDLALVENKLWTVV